VNKGSLWLIFTEEKKWVIELDNAGNLWYNYHFFSKIFKLISMNVVEKQHYITRWVEDALQNGMKYTGQQRNMYRVSVEEILQKGVKHTQNYLLHHHSQVEDVLQNGVKHTISHHSKTLYPVKVEDTIKNGVKKTLSVEEGTFTSIGFGVHVKDVLQNGVKHVRAFVNKGKKVEDAIQNGVKRTSYHGFEQQNIVEDTIQNGVKI
jgi:hypothetical protein